jgi:hypothetical protein
LPPPAFPRSLTFPGSTIVALARVIVTFGQRTTMNCTASLSI